MAAGDFTPTVDVWIGPLNVRRGQVEVPSTYATGGIPLSTASAKFGLATLLHADVQVLQDADEAWLGRYNPTTDKIQLFGSIAATDALQEMANATSLTSYVVTARAEGHKSGNVVYA